MTLYFMAFGYGILWRVWEFDVVHCRRVYFSLRLYWKHRAVNEPSKEWTLSDNHRMGGGICYTEKSKLRTGSWVLRGPWEKVA